MISNRKFCTFFVLLMLLASMIPIAVADTVKGTDEKIDVLYICYDKMWSMILISEDFNNEMYYKDNFEVHVFEAGYPTDFSGFDYDLESFDIVIIDMIAGEIPTEIETDLKDAHDNGVTLIAVANDYMGTTSTPDYFDFRDTAELTTNGKYDTETVGNFFKMYEDLSRFSEKEIQKIYAENILMFLVLAKNELINSGTVTDQNIKDITDEWEKNVVNIAYIGLGGSEDFGLLNQYSSFMSVTNIKAYNSAWGTNEEVIEFANNGGFAKQDLIIIDMVTGSYFDDINKGITADENKLENIKTPIIAIRSMGLPDYVINGDEDDEALAIGVTEQLLILFSKEYSNKTAADNWVVSGGIIKFGIYHPDLTDKYYATLDDYLAAYDDYDDKRPTVGIWFHKDYFTGGNSARVNVIDELIRDLESKDVNVIAGFDVFKDTGSGPNPMMKYYSKDGKVIIDSAISIKDFALSYDDYEAGLNWLEELDVVVLKAIIASSDGTVGSIPKDMLVYSTISPNRDGMGDFILLGNVGADGAKAFDEQKDWLANRAIKWAELKMRDNDIKRVVVMYYNYPPGKDSIGANYLDVMKSFAGKDNGGVNSGGILREMKKAGYDISYSYNGLPINDESNLNDTALLELVMKQGINVGAYAPGVLEEMVNARGDIDDDDWWGATLVPVEDYKKWFDDTIQNETIRNQIIDAWGEPWDYSKPLSSDQSGMMWEDENGKRYFVLPAIRLGNVYLMPQPDRALATDKAFAYHNGDIPPTHQYVAYYLWLNNDFKPDALINFGTHGTHEWLPGSAYGLSATDDLAPLLLQDIPNIYPYIVANVGEGLTAEYRGNALIIDHMTPPMIRSNLDSNKLLNDMETEIQAYFVATFSGDTDTNVQRQQNIVNWMIEADLHNVINMEKLQKKATADGKTLENYLKDMTQTEFSDFLKEYLYNYIEAIKEDTLPYGMHTYGEQPNEKQISAMVRAMWGVQYDTVLHDAYYSENIGIPSSEDEKIVSMTEKLSNAANAAEMKTILEAEYPSAKSKNHDAVIRFVIGPIMDFEGKTTAGEVMAVWAETDSDGNSVQKELIEEIKLAYYSFTVEPSDAVITADIESVAAYCLDKRDNEGREIDADLINEALMSVFKKSKIDSQGIVSYMTAESRLEYADRLRECGVSEMKSLMTALSAGYIRPNAGNDPVQNPSAIPTGMNFYGIDPDKFPTKAAWEVGKSLADQILINYYETYGEFPNTVAFSRFGVEFIRDEGALEACALYLMGVEPVWNPTNKNVEMKVNVLDYNDLTVMIDGQPVQRPRVDIVYTTAGMRDAFGDKLKLLNIAVKAVAEYEGDPDGAVNNVKTNSDKLKKAGFGDKAYMRCFANELGNYEIGTGNLVSASGSWDDPQQIVDMYLEKMGYLYGDDGVWGVEAKDLLKALLENVDATVHADSSNLYDTLDNDDFFQYYGALSMAVKYSRPDKRAPEMYVADTTNVGRNAQLNSGKIYGMKEYLNKDLEARYLNEKWIQGMMESGYAGSTMFSEFVDNFFGWAATSDGELTSFKNWEDIYDIYVNDRYEMGLNEYFKDNPYAYQSITARMLETMRHNLMIDNNLSGEQLENQLEKMNAMQDKLLNEYMDSVIANGVACCHHTCGNPKFSEFVDGQMSVLSADPDDEQYKKYMAYKEILEQAVPPKETTPPTTPTSSTGSGGYGTATVSPGAGQPAQTADTTQTSDPNGQGYGTDGGQAGNTPTVVTGYEMTMLESVTGSIRDFVSNPSVSASSIVVIGGIILLVGAVFYGFRRRNI